MSTCDDVVLNAAGMLERLQKEARKSVIAAYRFEKNVLCGSVIKLRSASVIGQYVIVVRFELNGEPYEREFEVVDVGMRAKLDKRSAFGYLVEAVEKEVLDIFRSQTLESFCNDVVATPAFKEKK